MMWHDAIGLFKSEGGVRRLIDATYQAMDGHVIACGAGLALSVYAFYVEHQKHKNPKYVAACDFNDKMSCSKVLTSEYSRGFGLMRHLVGEKSSMNLPNCLAGIIFYLLQLLLHVLYGRSYWPVSALFYSSLVSCLGSLYLAYVLAFILKDLCIVCISTYIVNFYLLWYNYRLYALS